MTASSLDLSPSPRRVTGERILAVATPLFEAVKVAPIGIRAKFPSILRNNNFALAVHVTRQHAFLEVTGKFRAQVARAADRLLVYRQVFTTPTSGEPALFTLTGTRLARMADFTAKAPHAFALGSDFSMCAWNLRSTATIDGNHRSHDIDIIYVVGFGRSIHEADCWQEFDSLIRVTLSDWSGMR